MAQQISAHADLEHYRKAAKALLKALRAGEPDAAARARAMLGALAPRPVKLSDAQLVIAREHGRPSWPAFRRAVAAAAAAPPGAPLASPTDALATARAGWGDRGEVVLDTGRRYAHDRPVRVLIRKRGRRYDLDDRGEAVRLAGAPAGWLTPARRAVETECLNINRRGVVFVPAVEGRDLTRLALRVADASVAVYAALLELDDGSG